MTTLITLATVREAERVRYAQPENSPEATSPWRPHGKKLAWLVLVPNISDSLLVHKDLALWACLVLAMVVVRKGLATVRETEARKVLERLRSSQTSGADPNVLHRAVVELGRMESGHRRFGTGLVLYGTAVAIAELVALLSGAPSILVSAMCVLIAFTTGMALLVGPRQQRKKAALFKSLLPSELDPGQPSVSFSPKSQET